MKLEIHERLCFITLRTFIIAIARFFLPCLKKQSHDFPRKKSHRELRQDWSYTEPGRAGKGCIDCGLLFFTAECCDYWERTIAYRWLAITYPRVACSSSCLLLVIAHHPPLMRAHALIQSSCGNHLTAVFCSPT